MKIRQLRNEHLAHEGPRVHFLLIVHAHNQENDIATRVEAARCLHYNVCVVDDGSTDRTAERAEDAGAQVLRLPVAIGDGAALRAGFKWALHQGYETVVHADAYVGLARVGPLVEVLDEAKADIAVESCSVPGVGGLSAVVRRWVMRLLSARVARAMDRRLRYPIPELCAIRRPLLDRFAADYPTEYHSVAAVVEAGRVGANIVEIIEQPGATTYATGTTSRDSTRGLWYLMKAVLAVELMPKAPLAPLHVLRSVPSISNGPDDVSEGE